MPPRGRHAGEDLCTQEQWVRPPKASVSLGHTGLCTSDPGPHVDAALISLPPDMDSEDARAPWDPCGAAAPSPTLEERDSPCTARPFRTEGQ